MADQPRTISGAHRDHRRFTLGPFRPDKAERPVYSPALTRELLARTAEIPSNRRALLAILTEYRHALYDLTVSVTADPPY